MQGLYPVILCGGIGARLWPLSRANMPKQFAGLQGERTMVQDTALRAARVAKNPPLFVCNDTHRLTLQRQIREIGGPLRTIVVEPQARNTAAAAIAAALLVYDADPNGIVLLLPSDHAITDENAFLQAVEHAVAAAREDFLVTFGMTPTGPATGYGYIKKGEKLTGLKDAYRIETFVEKPPLERAQAFLKSGEYFWNSGMFVFGAAALLAEAARLAPEVFAAAKAAYETAAKDAHFIRLGNAFVRAPNISLDHAIMEKTRRGAIVPASIGWSDVGSWSAVHDLQQQSEHGNTFLGDVAHHNVYNSYIRSNGTLIAAVGVRDLVVVATDDAILIADRNSAQDVKHIVDKLQQSKRNEAVDHARVERPWGSYQIVDSGEGFQVKRIIVRPGQRLSLQMHHKRAEHWTVVQGSARVTCGERVFDLKAGEATEIPLGAKHRLENTGESDMHLIEVQTGSYLGEDDIVRFEDAYGRV